MTSWPCVRRTGPTAWGDPTPCSTDAADARENAIGLSPAGTARTSTRPARSDPQHSRTRSAVGLLADVARLFEGWRDANGCVRLCLPPDVRSAASDLPFTTACS